MRPDDTTPPLATHPLPNRQAGINVAPRAAGNNEAANVVRQQINALLQQEEAAAPAVDTPPAATTAAPPVSEPVAAAAPTAAVTNLQAAHQAHESANPYERTHDESEHRTEPSAWQQYHSAWQSYYQQYYERYYVGQVHATKQSLEKQFARPQPENGDTFTTNEAMHDLRSKLRAQITARATKIRKNRHFIPILSGVMVMLIFLFLQYNRILFANIEAYVSPGSLSQSSIIVDAGSQTAVGPDPKLIAPSISVEVPIIWDANASSQDSLNAAMAKGVAWFNIPGASARPGEFGNFALSGHSANEWLDSSQYKFIFARLDQLKKDDNIYVNYNGTRYTYQVTGSKVVAPTDVAALQLGTDKPRITLITCTPLGTDWNRLLVFADQVNPDPATAAKVDEQTTSTGAKQMPSNPPTFFQKLFGLGG